MPLPGAVTNLNSKTVLGFITLLGLASVLSWYGKLTPEMVDVIKWVGGSYMMVRATANATENLRVKDDK